MNLRSTLSDSRSRLSFGLSAVAMVAAFLVSLLAISYRPIERVADDTLLKLRHHARGLADAT